KRPECPHVRRQGGPLCRRGRADGMPRAKDRARRSGGAGAGHRGLAQGARACRRHDVRLPRPDDGRTRVECRFADESLWLSQALMAELFQTSPQNITLHLKALYEEGESEESATCKEYLLVRREGGRDVRRKVKHYNLDAILAVGYRVRS